MNTRRRVSALSGVVLGYNVRIPFSRQQTSPKLDHAVAGLRRWVGDRRRVPPDRTRPGRITGVARHMVQVKLRHDIAEYADVQLSGAASASRQRASRQDSSNSCTRSAGSKSCSSRKPGKRGTRMTQ